MMRLTKSLHSLSKLMNLSRTSAHAAYTRSWRNSLKISFSNAPDLDKNVIIIDADYVKSELSEIVKDQDLSRYIL